MPFASHLLPGIVTPPGNGSGPVISAQPQPVETAVGGTAHFTVKVAGGESALFYFSWKRRFGALSSSATVSQIVPAGYSSAHSSTLTIPNVAAGDIDFYSCIVVQVGKGQVESSAAELVIPGIENHLGDPHYGYPTGPGTGTGAGAGVGAGGTLVTNLGTPGKDFYLDGNYSQAQPVGLPVPSYPYLDQGDAETVVYRQPFEQAAASYRPLDMKTTMPGTPGLYFFGDANFKDGQAGVYVFDRLFGNLPAKRVRRGQSHNYAFQYILQSGASITTSDDGSFSYDGPTYSIGTRVYPVDSIVEEEFFLDGEQNQYPLRRAPSFEQVGQSIVERGEDFNGNSFPLVVGAGGLIVGASGIEQILAEDDKYDDYRGAIKRRIRRIIAAPTVASFRNSA